MSDLTRLQWLLHRHSRSCQLPGARQQRSHPSSSPSWFRLPLLIAGLLATSLTGCTVLEQQLESVTSSESTTDSVAIEAQPPASPPPVETTPDLEVNSATPADVPPENSPPPPDTYPDALKKATLALTLSQSAQSTDDWALVAGRWQQAIDLMKAVPSSSENYNSVAAKITDYSRKRDAAKVKANQPVPTASPLGRVVVVADEENVAPALTSGETSNSDTAPERPAIASNPAPPVVIDDADGEKVVEGDGLYLAPIVRRSGGTPVIHVEFNNRYTVEMIVDTGASGTVLTQQVAQTLGVEPFGQTNMATASAQNVPFLLGRVTSIEVEGAILENSVVAIAGPGLETGLLGNDFFQDYDVTVKADVVEFRER